MAEAGYLNFDLGIERRTTGYRAEVLASPAGEARVDNIPVERLRAADVDAGTPQTVGAQLFEAVFQGEVLSCLRRSMDAAGRLRKGLRIRLRLGDVPELANLPWELLYDSSRDSFLALSRETPLVRYLDLPEPARDLDAQPRLRVLAVIASPAGFPPLDVEREWTNLKAGLSELEARGAVAVDRLESASVAALQNQLLRQEYHILHFLGHGDFDPAANDSVLLLQGEDGRAQAVSGQYFAALLRDHRSLRLALLNACRGAITSGQDHYSGVAQKLVRGGIPAVIAMREAISDDAALALVRAFYGALASGSAVDAALAEARKALFTGGHPDEWGTPVLYMRAADGDLWRKAEPQERGQIRRRALTSAAGAALVIALALLAYGLIGPTRMDPKSTMNVAVAPVGVIGEDGQMRGSADGDLIYRWLIESLATANSSVDAAEPTVAIWHDGLPRYQKRVKLGPVPGETPEDRGRAAAALAERVGADVVVYGHLDPGGAGSRFVQEFYVASRLRPEASETIGRYRLGDPVTLPADLANADSLARQALADRIGLRAEALLRLVGGLQQDMLGQHEQALASFRRAEAELTAWGARGEGKETLYYFIARQALFLDRYDEAEAAAAQAIAGNPRYPRAYIVLGGSLADRAQAQPPAERLAADGPLAGADSAYAQALTLALADGDTHMELIARLAAAGAHIMRGAAHYALATPEDDAQALAWFGRVEQQVRPLCAPGRAQTISPVGPGLQLPRRGRAARGEPGAAGQRSRGRARPLCRGPRCFRTMHCTGCYTARRSNTDGNDYRRHLPALRGCGGRCAAAVGWRWLDDTPEDRFGDVYLRGRAVGRVQRRWGATGRAGHGAGSNRCHVAGADSPPGYCGCGGSRDPGCSGGGRDPGCRDRGDSDTGAA